MLVSDMAMPAEDGCALIQAIRRREEGASAGSSRSRSRASHRTPITRRLRAGSDDHLAKPVAPETLLERIRILAASYDRAAA